MGKSVMIDSHVWELIKSHYKDINDNGRPTVDDRTVIEFILDKELKQFKHDNYMADKKRTAYIDEITRA